MADEIFTKDFLSIDPEIINSELSKNGYFAFSSAVQSKLLENIKADATKNRGAINANVLPGVYLNQQFYFLNLLAASKSFYDYCTSQTILGICSRVLGINFRLKALRYYETHGGHHMQWHTDNKTDRAVAQIPGLIFILYVSDVNDGEFQYIQGSHLWSGEKAYSDYSDDFINQNYLNEIKSFKMPSGSILIYNSYGIHRAKPVRDNNFIRRSIFFQVDSDISNSEPILINTSYVQEVNEQIKMYLGFGLKSNYLAFPNSTLFNLPIRVPLVLNLIYWIIFRSLRFIKKILKLS